MSAPGLRPFLGHWLLLSLPLLLLLLGLLLYWGDESALDLACRIHRLNHPDMRKFFGLLSDWGNPALYALAAVGLLRAWRRGDKRRLRWWLTFAVLQFLLAFLLVRLFKIALGVPRPDADDRLPRPWTFASSHHARPSGHTAEIAGTATVLALSSLSNFRTAMLGCFLALVAFSRIYLSWHSPMDVLSGWLVGSVAGLSVPLLADVDWRGLLRRAGRRA